MYEIQSSGMHPDFPKCWGTAGSHLQNQVQGKLSWLRATLDGPALEHLSFRMGNQLFFVRVEDVDGKVRGPGNAEGLLTIADGCAGVPCVMPMQFRNGQWEPARAGWGLVDARHGTTIEPVSLITDEKIEMTEWELHDFAVQVVRDTLEKEGKEITSTQSNPSVDPSVWVRGENGLEYVVVRAARYPASLPSVPDNIDAIAESCQCVSRIGSSAPIVVANGQDPFACNGEGALPLWRGYAMSVRFEGLTAL